MRLVFDKSDMESNPPTFDFTYTELQQITEALKAYRGMKKETLDKMRSIAAFSRTKWAYQLKKTTITAR